MKVASSAEMQAIDRITIEERGVPSSTLMECAGLAALKVFRSRFPLEGKSVLILCGPGNNGGDGLVMARHLLKLPVKPVAVLTGLPEKLTGDALSQFTILRNLGVPPVSITEESHLACLGELISSADYIVDALLGTGLKNPVRSLFASIITRINESGKPVIAVDIPSGIDGTSGHVMGVAVRAALTITMGLPKLGLLLYPGALYAGEVVVADIGFPESLVEKPELMAEISEPEKLASWLPGRPGNAHKGSCGKVMIFAGSPGYTGAAALACEACHRAGAGLVTLAVPESLHLLMEGKLTETITRPYPDLHGADEVEQALKILLSLAGEADAVAVGPGIGRLPAVQDLTEKLITGIGKPAVLDADALFPPIIEGHGMALPVLTPHPGEMARLMGVPTEEITGNPLHYGRACAQKYRASTVLKGSHSLISDPEGHTSVNASGNSAMATAGMGDVLTGIIAGLLAQGMSPHRAAVLGAFIHGLAGDFAACHIGPRGLKASDLLGHIPEILGHLSCGSFDKLEPFKPVKKVTLW
ncbi:MAG: NAD(P)H-hydrate dehydratase [Candidatus Eremiobacteraeota bacterium]|nr:NAD(P)H-hydrate dehydratase [Candidatus Eremiobacteraeota bacterium]